MKVKLLADADGPGGKMARGTTIEHPDAFILADVGTAVCVDDECRQALDDLRAGRRQLQTLNNHIEAVITPPGAVTEPVEP